MGAEEFTIIEVKSVFFIPGGMIGWGVEGVEAVEFGFDFWPICEGEAHAAEDLDRIVFDECDGVQ